MARLTFADTLKQNSIDMWQKILSHRFVTELSANVLPMNKFVFYLRQDHYFLERFCRFLQSTKQITKDDRMRKWVDCLYSSTVDFEMGMQKQLLDSLAALSSSPCNTAAHRKFFPCRTTLDYTSYLINTSSSGTFSEIVSVMAPCPWTYLEIAQKLSKIPILNEVYGKWVEFYSSTDSCRQVVEIKEILNRIGEKEDEMSKDIMKNHFANACKYEYLFWEMAYNMGAR